MQKQPCDLLIRGCAVLGEDFEPQFGRSVAILGGKIAAVGAAGALDARYEAADTLDGRGKLVMPGLVDAHTHTCQQFLRGRVLDALPMIWTRIMLPFESSLSPELAELGARLCCLEMIKSGTTAFAEAGGRHMERVAGVVRESGLRAALTCSTVDLGDVPASMKCPADEAVARNRALYDAFHGADGGRLSVYFSVRSILSCSEELILKVFDAARSLGTGVHAHMSEYPGEVNATLERHRLRPMEYFEALGVLNERFLAAHCILLSDGEVRLAARRGVKTAHCPFSNCGKGAPPTPALLAAGASVALGTDGAAHGGLSLWNEMKIFRSVMNARYGAPLQNPVVMPARALLTMATRGGAAALGQSDALGLVKEGYEADLITINLEQPHILPTSCLSNTLVETVNANDVADSIVHGRLLMRDRRVLTLDEGAVLSEAKRALASLQN